MTRALVFLLFILSLVVVLFVPFFTSTAFVAIYGPVSLSDSTQAILLCGMLALIVTILIGRSRAHGQFLIRLFLAALLVRMIVATSIFVFNGQAFFGGDAFTYDNFGYLQVLGWHGDEYAQLMAHGYVSKAGTGGDDLLRRRHL